MTDKRKQQIEALEQFFKKVQESHPFGLGDHEDYELIRSLLEDLKGEQPHLPDKDGYTQIQFTINVPEVRAEEMIDIIREKYPEARIRETWTLQPSKN